MSCYGQGSSVCQSVLAFLSFQRCTGLTVLTNRAAMQAFSCLHSRWRCAIDHCGVSYEKKHFLVKFKYLKHVFPPKWVYFSTCWCVNKKKKNTHCSCVLPPKKSSLCSPISHIWKLVTTNPSSTTYKSWMESARPTNWGQKTKQKTSRSLNANEAAHKRNVIWWVSLISQPWTVLPAHNWLSDHLECTPTHKNTAISKKRTQMTKNCSFFATKKRSIK